MLVLEELCGGELVLHEAGEDGRVVGLIFESHCTRTVLPAKYGCYSLMMHKVYEPLREVVYDLLCSNFEARLLAKEQPEIKERQEFIDKMLEIANAS